MWSLRDIEETVSNAAYVEVYRIHRAVVARCGRPPWMTVEGPRNPSLRPIGLSGPEPELTDVLLIDRDQPDLVAWWIDTDGHVFDHLADGFPLERAQAVNQAILR